MRSRAIERSRSMRHPRNATKSEKKNCMKIRIQIPDPESGSRFGLEQDERRGIDVPYTAAK